MNSSRVLLVLDPSASPAATLRAARRLAPGAARVHVLALSRGEADAGAVERLAESLPVPVEPCFDPSRASAVARREEADLVVVGPWPSWPPRTRALALYELASQSGGCDVLSVGERCPEELPPGAPVGLSFDAASPALGPITAAVRALPGQAPVVALVRDATQAQLDALEPELRALLPGRAVTLAAVPTALPTLAEDLDHAAAPHRVGLLVVSTDNLWRVSRLVASLAAAEVLERAHRPVLVLHQAASASWWPGRLTASDVVALPAAGAPVTVERTSELGRSALAPDERLVVVGAEALGPLAHEDGVVTLPAELLAGAPTVALASQADPSGVAALRVVRAERLVLFDAACPEAAWAELEAFAASHTLVAVRLRPEEALAAVRARLDAGVPWGGPVLLLDASAWLDDGGADDVPRALDGLRLQRLALQLLARGAPVEAVVCAEAAPSGGPFAVWTPEALRRRGPAAPLGRATAAPEGDAARWRLFTGSAPVPGHRLSLQLDNGAERRRLLAAVAGARERVHWQCYIVEDDEVTAEVTAALREAARRGVTVRVLVDSLYSLHDAFGSKNPALERLAADGLVEVRVARPVSGVPSLRDLKQRNHRKLVVIDGVAGTVTGRNLGKPYYRGFDEVPVTAATPYRDVPWLDLSTTLEGPLVEALERSFLADWVASGGAAFEVRPASPAGSLTCGLVRHDGFKDTHTLEALLELVRGARRSLLLVNTFPLSIEVQRALLAARRRGVDVTILLGHVRPRWGDEQPFEGGAFRELADELIRGRYHPVLEAGARGFEFALPHAALGQVYPHVHAKLYARDDELVLLGSANLDVTSSYWESELLLSVHDAGFARQARAALEAVLATSRPIDPASPGWSERSARRAWLGDNWPAYLG